jgi:hypothetical protein
VKRPETPQVVRPDRPEAKVIQVPNSIWAAWQVPIFLKEEDLAANLRSLGWQIVLPASTAGAARSAVA